MTNDTMGPSGVDGKRPDADFLPCGRRQKRS
jgi:hypothetical protein